MTQDTKRAMTILDDIDEYLLDNYQNENQAVHELVFLWLHSILEEKRQELEASKPDTDLRIVK